MEQHKSLLVTGNKGQNQINWSDYSAKGENRIHFWRNSAGNRLDFGEEFACNNLKIVFKGNNNRLIIGAHVRWIGHILIVGNNRQVEIGDFTTAQGVYILSRDADVKIGARCMFSREIEIRASDVHKIYDLASGEQVNPPRQVVIGDQVWLAARVIVSKGAVIPDGCVVGAASFVNKAFVEPNCILAGIPAKVLKTAIRWER